ncbi:hypothetical protein B0T22DRAFT_446005 [Podospora appendiculata]|uniref:Uncharacterized protein n=1 Tax=Podospora appendiculata TaxID=314037 RepID=A0AAE1C6X8_9PEZI|nr:hypothetical protein B0T22DRAFT_446005 [Podospora appendiculata]
MLCSRHGNGDTAYLKEMTLLALSLHDKTWDDVVWVGGQEFEISKEEFLDLANVRYNYQYGATEVAGDLVVVGKDFWLERAEYDGLEWWEFKTLPRRPERRLQAYGLLGEESLKIANLDSPSVPEIKAWKIKV